MKPGSKFEFRCAFAIVALTVTLAIGTVALSHATARAADEPDLISKRLMVFKLLTPNDNLATYGIDDPEVEGVACHFTVPERGGLKGWLGIAEEVSDLPARLGKLIWAAGSTSIFLSTEQYPAI